MSEDLTGLMQSVEISFKKNLRILTQKEEMYSPKIKEDLIPILFRLSKEKEKAMTRIVDDLLRPALLEYESQKAIPYCVSCYSVLYFPDKNRRVTAFCKECKSETFVLYTLPVENSYRKEVI